MHTTIETTTQQALSYLDYIALVENLVKEGKTSGERQTEELAGFTHLNLKRMLRLNKTLNLTESLVRQLADLKKNQNWVVITEAWCGDSAQTLPVIGKIAENSNGKINLSIVFKNENMELMNNYATNGALSIPKLIALNESGEELFTWGPRPAPAQKLLYKWKENPEGKSWDDFEKELHTWYARDKSITIQNEFSALLKRE